MTKSQRRNMQRLAVIMTLPIIPVCYIAGVVWHVVRSTFEAGIELWRP